jgi:hypothetical protein
MAYKTNVKFKRLWENVNRARGVVLGVYIEIQAGQQAMLEFLRTLPTTAEVVYLSGNDNGLSLWFSGPRQAGDYITHWSSTVYPTKRTPLHPLLPPEQYVAIRSDDMLSVQEAYMAGEGMDTHSVCPACQAKSLRQKFGKPHRAITVCTVSWFAMNQLWLLCRHARSPLKLRRRCEESQQDPCH